ncbi:MAG TPA: NADH-quinone oxidoreductase subunit M [bacterium]|nr:NADH-quinone oxidoreductase subunit M [bacterium]
MAENAAWLSLCLLLPLIGVAFLGIQKPGNDAQHYWSAMFASSLTFLASLAVWFLYDPAPGGGFGLVEQYPWIPGLGASYHVGVDGISLWLVLLTTLLVPLAIRSTWGPHPPHNYRAFLMLILTLETALIGVFVALDLVLFYVFWEAVLIPMYFLIGIWGGERRINSAMKFFVYTMVGSLLMLVAIFALWHASSTRTFDYLALLQDPNIINLPPATQFWLFGAFALAFAIKVPLFPLHTWLPDAHTDAPTAGSILLAGVLLKMGTYGLLRFNLPLFPHAVEPWTPALAALAIIGIIYGAWVAAAQTDMKRLVAYSSVSHMGFVVLGILAVNVIGATGATLQMVNHGITTGALFMLVGFLYDRRHTREISQFGGVIQVMPVYAICFWITLFASIGLPGLNGFAGEFLIFTGVAQASREMLVFAVSGVIWGAIYMLWLYQRVFLGRVDPRSENAHLTDLTGHEFRTILPLLALMVLLGLYSPLITASMQLSVDRLITLASIDAAGNVADRAQVMGVAPMPAGAEAEPGSPAEEPAAPAEPATDATGESPVEAPTDPDTPVASRAQDEATEPATPVTPPGDAGDGEAPAEPGAADGGGVPPSPGTAPAEGEEGAGGE